MRTRADLIMDHVRGPDVLDIGSADHIPRPGSRRWVYGRLKERFPATVGLDASAENIELLRRQGFDGLHVADAQDFSLDGRFDTIVAGEVIEHLENPAGFLSCAHAHLKPGGRLILTTPYAFGLLNTMYAYGAFPRTCPNPEHTMWFCPSTLTALAHRTGFKTLHRSLIVDIHDVDRLGKRLALGAYVVVTRLLPKRLRCNGMLFVLTPA